MTLLSCIHYRNTMLHTHMNVCIYSQLCRFAVNLPSYDISMIFSSAVYEAGGDEVLVQQLYESCSRTVANAAATLGNMARQEVIRCSILTHGAIEALVEPLKSTDTQVLVNSTLCLAMLVCDTEARAEVGVCMCLVTAQNAAFPCSHEIWSGVLHKVNIS